jgi:hypothetical protein
MGAVATRRPFRIACELGWIAFLTLAKHQQMLE